MVLGIGAVVGAVVAVVAVLGQLVEEVADDVEGLLNLGCELRRRAIWICRPREQRCQNREQ